METPAELTLSPPANPPVATTASMVGRITRGLGALSLSAGVQIIGQIFVVPVALYAWGKVRYGEWILLTGLVTFLRLTDLGLQTFVVNRLCASYAQDDRDEMQRALHSALRVQVPLVLTVAAVAAMGVLAFPFDKALALQTISGNAFYLVAMLLVFELLLGVPM